MFHIDSVGEPERAALNEAMLLWDEQVRSPIPANISAGLVMRETLASNGEDLSGQPYLEEAMHLASRSGLFDPSRAVHMYDQTQPGQTRQRAEFAWAVYAHHGYVLMRLLLSVFVLTLHAASIHSPPTPRHRYHCYSTLHRWIFRGQTTNKTPSNGRHSL